MKCQQVLRFAVAAAVASYCSAFTFETGAAGATIGSTAALGTGAVVLPGASIGTGLAVAGGILLLKAVALGGAALAAGSFRGSRRRGRRAAEGENQLELEFAAIARIEPDQCFRRLICDLATGKMPESDNDVILNLFENGKNVDISSPVFEFSLAAEVGKHVQDVEKCELRYSCPFGGDELIKATATTSS